MAEDRRDPDTHNPSVRAAQRRKKPLFEVELDDSSTALTSGLRFDPDGNEDQPRKERITAMRDALTRHEQAKRRRQGAPRPLPPAPRPHDQRRNPQAEQPAPPKRSRYAEHAEGPDEAERPTRERLLVHAPDDYDRALAHVDDEEQLLGQLFARPYSPSGGGIGVGSWRAVPPMPPAPRGVPLWRNPWVVILVSLLVIVLLWPRTGGSVLTGWTGSALNAPINAVSQALGLGSPFGQPNPPGNYTLRAPPSVTAEQIDTILASYDSPATGTGQIWIAMGNKYDIDPAFALAFFVHESTAGTHPGWAGLKPDGSSTHNVGNIICAGYARCHGRFRDYPSWEEGIEDWFRLISVEYIDGRGTNTVAEIIPIYAPAVENDVDAYVRTVEQLVDSWRRVNSADSLSVGDPGSLRPAGNPLGAPNAVMTQGYGIGSHAPANVWGAIDLAIDSNGDGSADPDGSWHQPIYASHSGIIQVSRDSWPAGNHVWVINDEYKTGYAHLEDFAVTDGQQVQRGTLIGYMGSTGQSSGPHLDYQVWHNEGGRWVNVNPLEYGALDPLR